MTIHHATAKKAASLEITLVEVEINGATSVEATGRKPKVVFGSYDPKQALAAVIMAKLFKAEYPALSILNIGDLDFVVYGVSEEEETRVELYQGDTIPTLADVLDAAVEAGIDPEAGFKEGAGVVVPEKYKVEYAARGNRDHCGDWLATQLDGKFAMGEDGKFDSESFTVFLVDNEVEMTGKWAGLPTSGQKGWIGRYRMNGRQKLEKVITRRGTLHLFGETITPPTVYLEYLLEKHPNVDAEWLD